METGLKDKVVIVTGGGSNIGLAISTAFANEGSNVVIAEKDVKQGSKAVEKITGMGGKAKVIETDVTSVESVQNMVKSVVDEYGKIDVLVNNVGWDDFKLFMKTAPAEYDKYININYKQVLICCNAVLTHMIEQKGGKIVNISSDAGRVGENREAIYSGCKAGVIGFSKALSKEVGRFGIHVNCVCPGATLPEEGAAGELSMFSGPDGLIAKFFGDEKVVKGMAKLYPIGRLGKASEIASVAVFFASDAASYCTGQTLSVSGGYSTL